MVDRFRCGHAGAEAFYSASMTVQRQPQGSCPKTVDARSENPNFKQKLLAKIKIIFAEVFLEVRHGPVAQGIVLELERPEDHLLLPKIAPSGPGPHLVHKRH